MVKKKLMVKMDLSFIPKIFYFKPTTLIERIYLISQSHHRYI